MRSIKGLFAGLVLAGIVAMPAAGIAHGGGGGGHAFGGFTGRGSSPGFSGTRRFSTGRFSTGRFSGRGDHGRFGDRPQYGWPVYWYPDYSYDYSYLDNGPNNDYQYGDNSAASVQPESLGPAVDHGPVVVITGNSRPMDSRANTAYVNSAYNSTKAAGQQKIATQDPNEKIEPRADPRTVIPPPVPQPAQTAAKGTQTTPQAHAGVFGNLVLVSWLEDAGKDVIYVQNTETNDVEKITSKPNLDNFRIVAVHPNSDPKLFEAVISNGSQQGSVRFRF
jgi:hypothetical protein